MIDKLYKIAKGLNARFPDGNDPFMIAWPLIKIGMSFDLEGKRKDAVIFYEKVIKLHNGAGAQFMAEKYIEEPIKTGDPFLVY